MTRKQRGYSFVELAVVLLIAFTILGVAIPKFTVFERNQRIGGDARTIAGDIGLTKMRAAADYTHARLYADLNAQTYRIEVWNKAGAGSWVAEGGTQPLSQGITFGFGNLTAPPANTQAAIGQAPSCLDATGKAIAQTACVVFNSRAVPVDATNSPTGNDAIYITDGTTTTGITVSATSLIQAWRSSATNVGWLKL